MSAVAATKRKYLDFDHPGGGRNPSKLHREIPLDLVDKHRFDRCEHYEDCSARTARTQWRSWTCARCPLYPGGAWLGEDDKPNLMAPIAEPPPVIETFVDLALIIAKHERTANTYVATESECSDCFGAIPRESFAWYCPQCARLICQACARGHRCAEALGRCLGSRGSTVRAGATRAATARSARGRRP